jgi:predicted permease
MFLSFQDLRYAWRVLWLNPGFTMGVALVLGLGIGANSAIFTVVNAVLLAPLPYREPDRLVRLYEHSPIGDGLYNVVSPANFLDWQREAKSFAGSALYSGETFNLSGRDGALPERLQGQICSYNLFSVLGAQPSLGRTFLLEDDRAEAERIAIISQSLWRRRFAGQPAVLGSFIRLDGESYKVVGVMPSGFDYPNAETQLWTPVWRNRPPDNKLSRGNHRYDVVARLRPGVSLEQAGAELNGIAKRIKRLHPTELTGDGATVALLHERTVSGARTLLLILLGAVGCVLLIACVNVTNLLLARAVSRRREAAIRLALGAGRTSLLCQFLAESTLLAAMGATLGLLFANWGVRLLTGAASSGIPRLAAVHVSAPVYLFTYAVAMITGIGVGLAPAFSSSGLNPASAIHETGRSSAGSRRRRLWSDLLVTVEVTLSLVLLISAGLLLKSFARLRAVDPGFAPEGVLTMRFSLPDAQYKTPAQRTAFFENLLARVRALPGVTEAGVVTILPVTGHWWDETFTIEGRPPLPPGQFLDALVRGADPGYFQTMRIPLKRGRFFTPAERLDAARQVIISESMARTFFPGEDPLGKRLSGLFGSRPYEIVGIVGDVRKELAAQPEPTMYFQLLRGGFNSAALAVRTTGDPNTLALPIQREVGRIDPDLPVVSVLTMEEVLSKGASPKLFSLTLLGLFAGLATVLAAIGLYGLLAYSVRRRTAELGIRMALGATPARVLRLALVQGLRPALFGIVAGLAVSAGAVRVLRSLLFQVESLDPYVFLPVAALLAGIALIACAVPARRASCIDPAVALRAE